LKRQGAIASINVQIDHIRDGLQVLDQAAGNVGPPLHHVVLNAFDDRGGQQCRSLHALTDQLVSAMADVQDEEDTESQ